MQYQKASLRFSAGEPLIAALLLCVLFGLCGCAVSDAPDVAEDGGTTIADVKDQMREVPALLLKFGSKNPADWPKAYLALKSLDEKVVPRELLRLAEQAADSTNPASLQARQTLERTGRIEMELTKLNTFNFDLWEDARRNLMAMGGDAVDSLILKTIMIFKRRNTRHWDLAKLLLKRIGQPAVPYLTGFVESASAPQSLRDQCAETVVFMAKLGEEEVKKGVTAPVSFVRKAYAYGLGASRSALSLQMLGKLATDPDWEVRGVVMQSLARIGGPEVVPVLVAGLGDAEPVVQYEAAQGLEAAKDKRAIGPLIDLLKRTPRSQEVELIRVDMAVAKALRTITGQEIGTDAAAWEAWHRKNR